MTRHDIFAARNRRDTAYEDLVAVVLRLAEFRDLVPDAIVRAALDARAAEHAVTVAGQRHLDTPTVLRNRVPDEQLEERYEGTW